ncbi:hypothetical protein EW146_g5073 [Bondarzewia mesenterica]|uniref:Piwi domain-containing protein n=1 Tax=Bondarzewia mesenterica TaxID=1095465 RepID=A0A4S4LUN8_9AGAM|nr:hypothetical protein EW146_g5073 [Bondarzewia mesenterica]
MEKAVAEIVAEDGEKVVAEIVAEDGEKAAVEIVAEDVEKPDAEIAAEDEAEGIAVLVAIAEVGPVAEPLPEALALRRRLLHQAVEVDLHCSSPPTSRPLESSDLAMTTIPPKMIHHYDVIDGGAELKLPMRATFEIIQRLQCDIEPNLFTPRGVYDGRKNFFCARPFDITLSDDPPAQASVGQQQAQSQPQSQRRTRRGPKVFKIIISHVAEINPEVLSRFLNGQQSNDNDVLTAITALNVAVRMQPSLNYPFNVRSFYTPAETRPIGAGIVLWRGYFQSVRPSPTRMLINVDISTGAMYKPGPLLDLCLEVLDPPPNRRRPDVIAPRRGLPDRERIRVGRFVEGIRVVNAYRAAVDSGSGRQKPRTVRRLSKLGARDCEFEMDQVGGETRRISVAEYFRDILNRPLQFPDVLCAELSTKALVPLELLEVMPGQIIKKQIPSDKTAAVLDFSKKDPTERMRSIQEGLNVLAYGQSEYMRTFGMEVSPEPLSIQARVLEPPLLKYGATGKQLTISCAPIQEWVVVIFERNQRFNEQAVDMMVRGVMDACTAVGIALTKGPAVVRWSNGQGRIGQQLLDACEECFNKTKIAVPSLIVVVLPDGANDIYSAVKQINVKLGGINVIPDPRYASILADPSNPTIVMGVDAMHPPPGSAEGRPSYAALVSSVDSNTSKYIATIRAQKSREDIIEDLQNMVQHVLEKYLLYRTNIEKKRGEAPKRIIFYRDGISEGRFREVMEREVEVIQKACRALKLSPKITFVVVGKRHHVRFFPRNNRDADRSGNCPAGTVVDRDVTSPVEFDYYLQSHGGLLGTSRSSHYNVLYDDNEFTPDGLQALSFALCHVYARCTRSVSIPAPVYYADIVCARAKHHYDPDSGILDTSFSETATNVGSEQRQQVMDRYTTGFKQLHETSFSIVAFNFG